MEKPTELSEIDIAELSEICHQYIDFIDNDDEYHEDNDFDHYIFETAMETIFGADVWEFINKRR